MKKAFLLPIAMTVLLAGVTQAVTVHWAVTTFPDGVGGVTWNNISEAVLVYTTSSSIAPVFSGTDFDTGSFSTGTEVGDVVNGLAITPAGIGEIASFDADVRTEGAYYVVLFTTQGATLNYAWSTLALAFDNSDSITTDPMAPATTPYNPGAFSGWTPVPEPGSASLLFAGIATVLLRRRRRRTA